MVEMSQKMRAFLSFFLFVCVALSSSAQAPASSELHLPSAFDNSFAGTLPTDAHAKSLGDERYGFIALFEVRVAPGIVKSLEIRQYFGNEEHAVQGFMRVKASLTQAHLVHVNWVTPTEGGVVIGN